MIVFKFQEKYEYREKQNSKCVSRVFLWIHKSEWDTSFPTIDGSRIRKEK